MSWVWWSMMSAWQKAEIGPFTSSPAAQLASSETVILWSSNVEETTYQVTTPAIAMMMPTTMDVIAATFRMARASPRQISARTCNVGGCVDGTDRRFQGGSLLPPWRVTERGKCSPAGSSRVSHDLLDAV